MNTAPLGAFNVGSKVNNAFLLLNAPAPPHGNASPPASPLLFGMTVPASPPVSTLSPAPSIYGSTSTSSLIAFKGGKADNACLLLTGPTPPHGDIQQPAPSSVLGNDAESGTSEATPAVALAMALVYDKDDFKRNVVADLDKIPQETLSAEVIESLHVKHVFGILKKFEGDPRQYDTVSRSAPKVLSNALKKKYKNSEALITDTIGHLKSERRKPRR
jgi:hypothetical protein